MRLVRLAGKGERMAEKAVRVAVFLKGCLPGVSAAWAKINA